MQGVHHVAWPPPPILEKTLKPPSFFTHTSHQCLLQHTPDTTDTELEVMGWFADGYEVLWIPIYEVGSEPDGWETAKAEQAHFGDARLVRDVSDFYLLPLGIKGWLFPAHLDDTTVICMRMQPREITFGVLTHPITEQVISFRTPTERVIPGYAAAQRDNVATERQV